MMVDLSHSRPYHLFLSMTDKKQDRKRQRERETDSDKEMKPPGVEALLRPECKRSVKTETRS